MLWQYFGHNVTNYIFRHNVTILTFSAQTEFKTLIKKSHISYEVKALFSESLPPICVHANRFKTHKIVFFDMRTQCNLADSDQNLIGRIFSAGLADKLKQQSSIHLDF